MGFKVSADDLELYRWMISRAGQDAMAAKQYLDQHGKISSPDQGLFTRPFQFHDSLHSDVAKVLNRLHTLLESSSRELAKSADYYRRTDTQEATKMDGLQPPAKR
ncbi:hypothetical protein HCC61_00275 [Streptomyces sp. HNM0575]|uniref:hypothetical protein n=1 Tax=Streptomyces sp. HNM0575 TaxID=2716338 RepID=UPI00145C5B2A|nr:hypothetical protein [Streptomyces sp. HNM0575]NLU71154.1 hypothetical protein [Streptomyces sp. HNM0575]